MYENCLFFPLFLFPPKKEGRRKGEWLGKPVLHNYFSNPFDFHPLEEYTDPEYVTGPTPQSTESNMDWLYGKS